MIPEFIKPLNKHNLKTELEWFCSFVPDDQWDRVEANVWKRLFKEAQPLLNTDSTFFSLFNLYFESGDNLYLENYVNSKRLDDYHALLNSFLNRSLMEMNNAVYRLQMDANDGDFIDHFQKNAYHQIVQEIINWHDDRGLTFETDKLSHRVINAYPFITHYKNINT